MWHHLVQDPPNAAISLEVQMLNTIKNINCPSYLHKRYSLPSTYYATIQNTPPNSSTVTKTNTLGCGFLPPGAEDGEIPGAGLSVSSTYCGPDEGKFHVQEFLCLYSGGARGEGDSDLL